MPLTRCSGPVVPREWDPFQQEVLGERTVVCGPEFPKKEEALSHHKSQIRPNLALSHRPPAGSEPLDGDNLEVEGKKVLSLFL